MAKNIKFITAKGTARYPRITEADTKGQYADGKYKTELLVPKAQAKALIDELKRVAKEELPKLKEPKMPFKIDEDDEDNVIFRIKSKFQPLIFDGTGKQVSKLKSRLAGGSIVKIAGNIFPYDKGLSLQMKQVQVLELYTGAESMFEAEEGTFKAEEWEDDSAPKTFDGGADEGSEESTDGPDI